MRTSLVLPILIALVGCAADPPGASEHAHQLTEHVISTVATTATDPGPSVCELAAQLAADDICSLVCDPDALAAELSAEGEPSGQCIELRCALTATDSVDVGVCL